MRILLLQEADWIKRGPHQQHHLIDRMALRGHEVRVIDHQLQWREDTNTEVLPRRIVVPRAYKIYPEAGAHITLVRPRAIKLSGLNTASIVPFHLMEILRQVDEFKPDIILSFGVLNAHLGLRVAQRNNIPFVYYLIDQLHTLLSHPLKRGLAKRVERWNLQSADAIFVINQGLKDYAKRMGARESKISVITAGVNFKMFNRDLDGQSVRKRYGIAQDDILLFFMGFMYDFSGLKEVAQSILESPPNVKLMVVGDGDLYVPLLEVAAHHNAGDKIILTGKVPFGEVPSYVAAADICLLPAYRNEIMMNIVPIKMYEYLAMGKPVIATSLPGIVKEFGFDSGILYVDKPEEVLQKTIELTPEELRTQGVKARRAVENKDWRTIADEFERTLHDAINTHNDSKSTSRLPAGNIDH
jgi:glycosyltransferase involved in cell wall biosynthesis